MKATLRKFIGRRGHCRLLRRGARARSTRRRGRRRQCRQRADPRHGEPADRDQCVAPRLLQPESARDIALRPAKLKRRHRRADRLLQQSRGGERHHLPGDPDCDWLGKHATSTRQSYRCKRPLSQQRGQQSGGAGRHAFRRVQRLHDADTTLVTRGVRHAKLQQLLPAQHRQSVSEDAHGPSDLGLRLPRRDDQRPHAGGGLDRTAAR